jgi:hypothetical protein
MTTNDIHPDERCIDNYTDFEYIAAEAALERRPSVSVVFKTGDEPEFRKPDHDPHGETFAAVSHSSASCDTPGCETSGLVPTSLLEDADGLTGCPPFALICEVCAEARDNDEYEF